ncbi:MAG: hypothetical protein ACKN9W_02840 [Methylococcus sp.]
MLHAAQSEWEPNNTPEEANGNTFSKLDISDQIVGQLFTADIDYFYVDVYPGSKQAGIPVYFGCNLSLPKPKVLERTQLPDGSYVTSWVEVDVYWKIEYYYSASGFGNDLVLQSSYEVSSDYCKQNAADIKGPFRFQMNTVNPGRYYVRITGNTDLNLSGKATGPLSDYTLWAVTRIIPDMPEPNDGKLEATRLRRNQRMTGQLASMYDQDWFYLKVGNGSPRKAQARFRCEGAQDSDIYYVSWYDPNVVQQASYQVSAINCKEQTFNFNMRTRAVGNYYLVITPPPGPAGTESFGNTDYTMRVGNVQTSSGGGSESSPCPSGQTLVKVPLPVTTENCGRKPLAFCTPYTWQCQ